MHIQLIIQYDSEVLSRVAASVPCSVQKLAILGLTIFWSKTYYLCCIYYQI